MDSISMSYKGFTLDVNPQRIGMHFGKHISTSIMPLKKAKTQELCHRPCVVTGSGILTGSRAQEQALSLLNCYRSQGADYLFLPLMPPVKMFFTALRLETDAEKGCVDYYFEFTEDPSDKRITRRSRYTVAAEGENLFDIANRTGYPVEYLAERNGVRNLFAVKDGDTIWLR